MSKRYNIRWTDNDSNDLRKAVKNFNAKITRLEKKIQKTIDTSPDKNVREQARQLKNALPDRVSVKAKRELITTRQDLKRELKSLQRFTEKGAEQLVEIPDNQYNLKLTKWQKQDIINRTRVINRNRKIMLEQVEKLPASSRGQQLGYTVSMGDTDLKQFEPLKPFTYTMDRTGLNKRHLSVIKESQSEYWDFRNRVLQDTYINQIELTFGDRPRAKAIIEKIKSLSPKEFYKIFKGEVDAFEWVYIENEKEYDSKLSALESTFTPNKRS